MERITNKLVSGASILDPKTRAQACESATMEFIYPHRAFSRTEAKHGSPVRI